MGWIDQLIEAGKELGIWHDDSQAKKLAREQAYCFGCKRARDFMAVIRRQNPNGTWTAKGQCSAGHKVARIISAADSAAISEDIANLNSVSRRERLARALPAGKTSRGRITPGSIIESTTHDGKTAVVKGAALPITGGSDSIEPGSRVRAVYLGASLRLVNETEDAG